MCAAHKRHMLCTVSDHGYHISQTTTGSHCFMISFYRICCCDTIYDYHILPHV